MEVSANDSRDMLDSPSPARPVIAVLIPGHN
jgi:hypothetical protein